MGVGGVALTHSRSQVVSYLYPVRTGIVTFMTSEPEPEEDLSLVIKPLDDFVWLCLLCSLLACILFDRLYKRLNVYAKNNKVFWISIYSLFQQQIYSFEVLTLSHNVWFSFWSFGTFVLIAAYAGCLFSMIYRTTTATIDSVEELTDAAVSSKIPIYVPNNSYISNGILVSTDNM